MRPQISEGGLGASTSQMFAGILTNAPDANKQFDIGKFYFPQQVKFSILQTLILVEVILSSSSRVIYTLSAAGIAVLWFFTVLVRDDQAKRSLNLLFPLLLMASTTLLSVIVLIKVYFAHEQSDVSLVFLGVAFTSDNFILMLEAIPMTGMFMLSGGSARHVQQQRRNSVSPEDDDDDVKESCWTSCMKRVPILMKIQDSFAAIAIICVFFISGVIVGLHALLAAPIAYIVFEYTVKRKLDVWEKKVNKERRVIGEYETSNVSDEVKGKATYAVQLSTFLFVSVMLVDLEFLAIAIAMSEVSGANRYGGVPIDRNQTGI